jgi:hypothetical protein
VNDEKRMMYLLKATLFDEYGQHGATQREIDGASTDLTAELALGNISVPPIPADYAEFLRLSNGYEWNGARFFGTAPLALGRGYSVPSLLERNAYYHDMKSGLQDCLVLGEFDDTLFYYSGVTGKYVAADELTLIPEYDPFDSFEELFYGFVDVLYCESCSPREKKAYCKALGVPDWED